MDLTEIRNRVMEKTGNSNPDYIDSEINMVQRQYIQPIARVPGEAYYTTEAEKTVEGENLTTADNLTYTSKHSPIKRGSLTLYDADGDEIKESDANYPAVNYDAGSMIFDAGEPDVTADYTSVVVVSLTDIANDIHRINFIADITNGTRWDNVNLLLDFDACSHGVRVSNGKVYFHGITEGRTLLFGYHVKLTDLSATNVTPEIDEQWHDLYWLGAAAMINPERYYALFQDRLREFKLDRISESRPHGQKLRVKGWW